MGIHILHILLVERQLADVVVANGIAQRLVGRRPLIALLDLTEHGRSDSAWPSCACTESSAVPKTITDKKRLFMSRCIYVCIMYVDIRNKFTHEPQNHLVR